MKSDKIEHFFSFNFLFFPVDGLIFYFISMSIHNFLIQVTEISTNSFGMPTNGFLCVFHKIIENCCQPLCMAWLEEELHLICGKADKVLVLYLHFACHASCSTFAKQCYCGTSCLRFTGNMWSKTIIFTLILLWQELFAILESKLLGYDSILQNIRKSGKENLYAELVYALKFGLSRYMS